MAGVLKEPACTSRKIETVNLSLAPRQGAESHKFSKRFNAPVLESSGIILTNLDLAHRRCVEIPFILLFTEPDLLQRVEIDLHD